MSQVPVIECKKDGPFLVRDLALLRDARGERIAIEGVVALCRCGGSKKKPFCDGTHRTNGFSGARLADGSADRLEHYRGRQVTIHDNRSLCSHSGACTDGLAAVFRYGQEPWIDPEGAKTEQIVAAVQRCPSGALSFSLAGAETNDAPREPSITATLDGPYAVQGGVRLADQRFGDGASSEHYTLCRCGGSKNKPFCDGTHWAIGFKG